jgi:hypothetical protein
MGHSHSVIFGERGTKNLSTVNVTVVKVHTKPTRMRFSAVWKYCEQQQFHNLVKEVLCVVTVLLSHRIDDVTTNNFPNNNQHKLLSRDSLFDPLKDITARHALFRGMVKFQNKPTLIPSDKSLKFTFVMGFKNGRQLSASFHQAMS